MSYAICSVPVAPLRIEPDHRAEMTSQLLFGECCIIRVVEKGGWVKIVNQYDAYSGWCRQSHFREIDEAQYYLQQNDLAADWVNEIDLNGELMRIPFGSSLKVVKPGQVYTGKLWKPATALQNAETIRQLAFTFLNTAYLWGGRSVFGTDCSGFTQSVYKFLNIPLLRDAQQQATKGGLVGFLQEARCGDLAFFDNEDGNIIHTGILLNATTIIHAAGKVKIDKIDNAGIIDAETGQRLQHLRVIKRYL
jgi:gamma-D-glutamyl-L-lysine dipeptidyl-peptidase